MKTLVLANHKGGVGKSAVATLLAHYFVVSLKLRVLAIDLDHQGNFSDPLQKSKRALVAPVSAHELMTTVVSSLPTASMVVVPSHRDLIGLERQPAMHTPFARNLRAFLAAMDHQFDVCVIDTNPNPDIRMIAALASADFVLSPVEMTQEAMDGLAALLNHERVGLRKIKAVLNPKLRLIGLLPSKVEATPFQKANFIQVIRQYQSLLIPLSDRLGDVASVPKRTAIAEAQGEGALLWEVRKTAARDAWKEIEPSLARIADIVTSKENSDGQTAA
jgi:chromosome partitioning protein